MTPAEKTKLNHQEILIVDDTPASLQLLAKILTDQGFRVRPASNGTIALRSIEAKPPDLILLDIKLPDINGYEICSRLKTNKRFENIPIIFISALDDTTEKIKGFQAGAIDYITKPFEPEEVLARVKTHLNLKELTENLEDMVKERTEKLSSTNEKLNNEIKERKKIEKALRSSETRYRALYDNNPSMYFTVDTAGNILSVNPFGAEQLGYSMKELIGKPVNVIFYHKDIKKLQEHITICSKNPGKLLHWELRKVHKDGHILWARESARAVTAPDGKTTILSVCEDITDRKLAEEELEKNLKEKDALLKEIHHRVKNNMQIMSSLLKLQLAKISNKKQAEEAFKDSVDRIQAMALVHESMYRSHEFAQVDMSLYTKSMCQQLLIAYSFDKTIKPEVNIENIFLSMNLAIPCGLILNELVTNAIKHAYGDHKDGTLKISFIKNKDNTYTLTVQDRGKGLPEQYDLEETESFGLLIVNLLTKQIGGQIEIDRNNGTCFQIIFPVQ